jgi:cytochrome c biogenesis protein CcmG/thiol:disulfide interchange protein DsbE
MNRRVLVFGILIITPLLIFLALSFGKDPRAIDSPLVGKPAPNFSLRGIDGEVVQLKDFRGQPVFLNFWATWCQPCIVEHPVLQAGARRYEGRVQFLGVVYHDETDKIRRFLDQRGEWGPTLLDEDGTVAVAYGVYGAPETFFIDRDGIIVEKWTGNVEPNYLVRMLDGLL